MGNRREDYDDRDDYDEDEDAEQKSVSKCMCCSLKTGMAAGGVVVWSMVALNVTYMIVTMQQGGSAFFTMIAGSLMRNSSAYILWLVGFMVGLIGILTSTIKHPIGLKQMAYLNLLATGVFCAIIVYHGYTAAQDAYIMDGLDQGKNALFKKIQKGLFKSNIAPKGDAAATVASKLTELAIWTTIVVSTSLISPLSFSTSYQTVLLNSLPSSCLVKDSAISFG